MWPLYLMKEKEPIVQRVKLNLSIKFSQFVKIYPLTTVLWKKLKNVYVLASDFGWSDLGTGDLI